MERDATLDPSRTYRYSLRRQWGGDKENVVNFILLNPSTADATRDDPTIKACIDFSKKWGFDGLVVTNLFAFRATNPKELKTTADPIGKDNDRYIQEIAYSSKAIVIAWGNHGKLLNRNIEVLKILKSIKKPLHFSITASGNPKHPLYIKRSAVPAVFELPT